MAFNYSKLRGRIVEKYGTQSNFADALGKPIQTISTKLNNKVGFTREDILVWSKLLDISESEYGAYFFDRNVEQG